MEEFIYLDEETMDCYDPHEYCEDQQPSAVPVNFRTYTKRSFLSACIKLIYLMSDWNPPNVTTIAENDKNQIRSILESVVASQKFDPYYAAIENVKKRLFCGTRQTARKMQRPMRKQALTIECEYFKPKRHILGVRKLRRNLISQELKEAHLAWLHGERTLANERVLEASVHSMVYLNGLLGSVPYA